MSIRKIIFWAHLISGVLAGLVVLVMSITGVCLAFESQLFDRAERNQRRVSSPSIDSKRLAFDELAAKARAEIPDAALTGLTLRAEPNAAVMLNFGRDHVLYMNPYTGAVLGQGSKIRGVMQQIENWHRWLGVSDSHRVAGRAVTDASNCVFLFLAVSGLYIWWPRNWKWKALRLSIWFTKRLRGRQRDWNWHNTIGLWCSPILIALTLTGVVMSYQWATNLLYRATGNEAPAPQGERSGGNGNRKENGAQTHRENGPRHSASLDALMEKAETQKTDWSIITLRLPQREGAPVTFSIQDSSSRFAFYRSQLTLNSSTGEIVKWEPFSEQNAGRKLRSWVRFLHTGEALGVAGQAVVAIASLGGVVLVWTGLAMAFRRFLGRKTQLATK